MPPFLAPLFTKLGGYLLLAGAVILAVTALVFKLEAAGRLAEQAANRKRALDAEADRKTIDLAISVGGAAQRQRLRDAYSRD